MLSSGQPSWLLHKVFVEKSCQYRIWSRNVELKRKTEQRGPVVTQLSKSNCRVFHWNCQESPCPLLLKAWKAEAAALKPVKALMLSLKIYPTLKLWSTAEPFIQAVTCLSPTLSAWTWLLCAEVRAGTLVMQLVRYLWENHGRFLLGCDFAFGVPTSVVVFQKEAVMDHCDFSDWCGCSSLRYFMKYPILKKGRKPKEICWL